MLKPRLIPCLLVQGGGLVKTVKFTDPKYVGDPINAVRIFNEKAVLGLGRGLVTTGMLNEEAVEQAITVWDAYEGQLIGLMRQITADFPDATLFSLPTLAEEGQRRSLELGMKGAAECVAAAMASIKAELDARGLEWQDKA